MVRSKTDYVAHVNYLYTWYKHSLSLQIEKGSNKRHERGSFASVYVQTKVLVAYGKWRYNSIDS
jgi:hypothetical protein